jgi:LysM repeat protein
MTAPVTDVTPAATYTVKSGDNLWNLAKKNHLTAPELAAANNLRPSTILQPGQKLIIPSKAGSNAASPRASGTSAAAPSIAGSTAMPSSSTTKAADAAAPAKGSPDDLKHVVKSGETLGEIAHKYGVKARDLALKNNIADPQKLRAGTELIIPGWNSTTAKSGKTTSSDSGSKSAPPSTAPAPATEPEPAASPVTTPVPVIHIDDNPLTPAPKP